jgi:hypothetical protein
MAHWIAWLTLVLDRVRMPSIGAANSFPDVMLFFPAAST